MDRTLVSRQLPIRPAGSRSSDISTIRLISERPRTVISQQLTRVRCAGRALSRLATPTSSLRRSLHLFEATFSGTSFVENRKSIPIGVAGNLVVFLLDEEAPYLAEEVASNTYLAFFGRPQAIVTTSAAPTISVPFEGMIEYCALNQPMAEYYACGPTSIKRGQCISRNHQLILTRR